MFESSYKYHPKSLRSALFPSPDHDQSDGQRSRKRRRVSPQTDSASTVQAESSFIRRSLLLETSSETFVLRPQPQPRIGERDKENASIDDRKPRQYSLALVVHEDKVADAQDKDVEIPDAKPSGRPPIAVEPPKSDAETVPPPADVVKGDSEASPDAEAAASSDIPPIKPNTTTSVLLTSQPTAPPSEVPHEKPQGNRKTTIHVLQQGIGEDNLDFAEDGVNVLSDEVENGSRRGFKLEVKTWRWTDLDSEVIEVW